MERVSILLFLSCSLVAAIQAGDLQTCARNYKRVGCFAEKGDQSSNMLIYDRYGIQWKNIKAYMHSLACRCEKKAREAKKYAGFAIHFWGECYGKTQAQIDAVNGKTQSLECTGDQKYDGCAADAKECAGHAYTDFVYQLAAEKGNEFTKRSCNDSDAELSCNGKGSIKVLAFSYGPRSAKICGAPIAEGWTSNCGVVRHGDTVTMASLCDNEGTCNLKGWTTDLKDPCLAKPKYLEIKYECVKL